MDIFSNFYLSEITLLPLKSEVGGAKSRSKTTHITIRILKFLKFCCVDVEEHWERTTQTIDFCLVTVELVNDFLNELRSKWSMSYSGVLGYINEISHALDFRRLNGTLDGTVRMFSVVKIFLSRIRKCLGKKMRIQWDNYLSIEYLEEQGCWATLQQIDSVVSFHKALTKLSLIVRGMDKHHLMICHFVCNYSSVS